MNAFKVFANAYETLSDRVNAVKMKENIGPSILACILGGNYSSYIIQRQTMKSLK
jgi:non-canonical poly(A) RNA polymerase PAPD5/7